MNIDINGIPDIQQIAARFTATSAQVTAQATAVVVKTAADIVRDAQAVVPVDTGFLKNSISFDMTGPAAAEIGPTANYGRYIEYGTSRMGPRPYMGPAFDRNMPAFLAAAAALGASAAGP